MYKRQAVFADSYAIGIKNHEAFYQANKNNKSASFVFLQNGDKPQKLDEIPREMLSLNRHELKKFASETVKLSGAPDHVVRGANIHERAWDD